MHQCIHGLLTSLSAHTCRHLRVKRSGSMNKGPSKKAIIQSVDLSLSEFIFSMTFFLYFPDGRLVNAGVEVMDYFCHCNKYICLFTCTFYDA